MHLVRKGQKENITVLRRAPQPPPKPKRPSPYTPTPDHPHHLLAPSRWQGGLWEDPTVPWPWNSTLNQWEMTAACSIFFFLHFQQGGNLSLASSPQFLPNDSNFSSGADSNLVVSEWNECCVNCPFLHGAQIETISGGLGVGGARTQLCETWHLNYPHLGAPRYSHSINRTCRY